MLSEAVRRISDAETAGELEAVLATLAAELGFSSAAYYRLTRLGSPVTPRLILGAGFDAWNAVYLEQRYVAVDPVIPLIFRRDLPFTVREVEAEYPEPSRLHADRRTYWAPDGLFCPVATSWSELGVICWGSQDELRLADHDRQAIGNLSRAMVARLKQVSPQEAIPNLPLRPLSRREGECAFWAAEGKRANEIADILGLSVHTVRQYLDSAVLKLKARNRAEMLLRASALGLIADHGLAGA